jgi:hypothetical protein
MASLGALSGLKPFDYMVIIYGLIGTLLTLASAPKGVLVFWGFFSALACVPSILALIVGLIFKYPPERLTYVYYAVSNLAPTIAFVHLVNPEVIPV